jgi:hypothetical protein
MAKKLHSLGLALGGLGLTAHPGIRTGSEKEYQYYSDHRAFVQWLVVNRGPLSQGVFLTPSKPWG